MQLTQAGDLQKMQSAATEVEKAATQAADSSVPARHPATHVIVDQPTFRLNSFLWKSSLGTFEVLGQTAVVVVLASFLLLSGDKFKRSLVRLTATTQLRKQITVQILNDINHSIQKYLLMMLTTNLLVALLSWLAFHWLGLENAGPWSAAAGLLHIVPYLGPVVTAAATGMAAFIQINSLSMALLIGGASLAIAAVIGVFVGTWMTGRNASINPAAVSLH